MTKRTAKKNESNPLGLFGDYEKKPMQENLFDLLSLYNILLSRYAPLLPDERREEFKSAQKLINDQRRLYEKKAQEQQDAEKRLADYKASKLQGQNND